MYSKLSSVCFLSGLLSLTTSFPLAKRGFSDGPVIANNFADPAYIKVADVYFGFSTTNGKQNVPVAQTTDFNKPWSETNVDAMPDLPAWTDGYIWAPHVVQAGDGFVLYYSGRVKNNPDHKHCVGVATSKYVGGPYVSQDQPLACPIDQGGAIDPAGFKDQDGTLYVVYKVDGNGLGGGGKCGNANGRFKTPLMLQKLKADGVTPDGNPVQILDRDKNDGPLIEAPSLVYANGQYTLFFSSNCYNTDLYDVSYAYADNVAGPYTKAHKPDAPLLITGANGGKLHAPGGATVDPDGTKMVFHADLKPADASVRQMWTADISIQKGKVSITGGSVTSKAVLDASTEGTLDAPDGTETTDPPTDTTNPPAATGTVETS